MRKKSLIFSTILKTDVWKKSTVTDCTMYHIVAYPYIHSIATFIKIYGSRLFLSFWSLSEDWQLWQLLIFLEYLDLEFVGLFFYIAYIIHILSFNSIPNIYYLIISRKQFHIYIYIHIQVYIFNFPVYSNKLKYPLILSLLPSHLFPIK